MEPSSSTHQIKPYIPREFSIQGKYSYSTFMKRKPKVLSQFIFNSSNSPQHKHQKDRLRLLKAIKQLKHVHNLDLNQYRHCHLPFIKSCAKRMMRIKYLSRSISQKIETTHPKSFQVWPKYIHRLKSLTDAWSIDQFFLGFGGISLLNRIKSKSQKELFRYQNHLESLQIKFENVMSSFHILHFDKYPTSLQKLSFSGGVFSQPVPPTSLDHFKNLKILELDFHKDSSAKFINSLISILPNAPQLESLSFFSPLEAFSGLEKSFQSLKNLTMLKHMKIHSCNLRFPHSKILLKVLRKLSLKSLYLKVEMKDSQDINLILNLLEQLYQLEALKLQIDSEKVLEPLVIEEIFEKVDKLNNLRDLSLTVNTPTPPNKDSRETIQLPFSNIFAKQTPLKSFQIASNYVNVSKKDFLDLLKSLQKQVASLKNIKLEIGEVLLGQKEFKKFLKFLGKLNQNIRVLKPSMLGVYNQSHLMEIIENIGTLKYLRSFGLGRFYARIPKEAFWIGAKKILSKPGLVKFTCDVSKDMEEKALIIDRRVLWSFWPTIKKKNPALVKSPKIFSSRCPDYGESWV